jgi:MFS family permease
MTLSDIEHARPATEPTTDRQWHLRHGPGFWVVAVAFLFVMAFATVPTTLYGIYQQRDGFPPLVITVVFGAFAVGVMLSLYLAGHLSDAFGRRPMILVSVLVEVVAALVFLSSTELPALLLARLLTGIGVGILTATATAHLGELRVAARPQEEPGVAGVLAGLVNIGGLSLGALVGGALAELAPAPLRTPYVVFLVLLVVAALAVALVPETVERREERPAYRPQRVAVPPSSRGMFWAAAGTAFTAFSVFGLFTSLAPSFLATAVHVTNHLVAGAVTFAVFASAALVQVATRRWTVRRQLRTGVLGLVVGLGGVAGGAAAASLPLFVAAGVVAGAGVGLLFRAAVATAGSLAPAHARGEVLAALFLMAYAGITVPVVLVGVALLALSPLVVLLGFAVAAAAAAAVTSRLMLRRM